MEGPRARNSFAGEGGDIGENVDTHETRTESIPVTRKGQRGRIIASFLVVALMLVFGGFVTIWWRSPEDVRETEIQAIPGSEIKHFLPTPTPQLERFNDLHNSLSLNFENGKSKSV